VHAALLFRRQKLILDIKYRPAAQEAARVIFSVTRIQLFELRCHWTLFTESLAHCRDRYRVTLSANMSRFRSRLSGQRQYRPLNHGATTFLHLCPLLQSTSPPTSLSKKILVRPLLPSQAMLSGSAYLTCPATCPTTCPALVYNFNS
jgi:hypothetical protein